MHCNCCIILFVMVTGGFQGGCRVFPIQSCTQVNLVALVTKYLPCRQAKDQARCAGRYASLDLGDTPDQG